MTGSIVPPPDHPPDVFASTELRWFRDGPLPVAGADLWNDAAVPAPAVQERPDIYYLARDVGLGLKVRGGEGPSRLEVKSRVSRVPWRAGDRAGFREAWRKWSWPGAGPAAGGFGAEGPWVVVEKRRLLWTLEATGEGLRFVEAGVRVREGAGVEITELRTDEGTAWTLGAEAFGIGTRPDRIADEAAGMLLAAVGLDLAAEESMGYPEFLRDRLGDA